MNQRCFQRWRWRLRGLNNRLGMSDRSGIGRNAKRRSISDREVADGASCARISARPLLSFIACRVCPAGIGRSVCSSRRSRLRSSVDSSTGAVAACLQGSCWAGLSAAQRARPAICRRRWKGRTCSCAVTLHRCSHEAARDSQFVLDVDRAAQRCLAADPPRLVPRGARAASRRAVAAGRATQASQRFRESRRVRITKPSCFATASARLAMCATTRATRRLAPPSSRYAVTRVRALDLRSHSRGGAR